MRISVIIPNYNGEELLRNNLPKVIENVCNNKKYAIEFIIVDDGSTDTSKSVISNLLTLRQSEQSRISNLKFIQNDKNLGFSSAVNRGVKEASGEILVLLNTDVIPDKNFLDPLITQFSDEKVFAVGCMDKSLEKGKTILRGRGIGKWVKGFLIHARGEVDKNNTLWVNGGSGAFRKNVWDKLKGFNELYNPFYWEDIDLSYRALKSGYQILFEPKSTVTHYHEKGSIINQYSSSKIRTIAYRNQFIFAWENLTDLDLQFMHILFLPYHFVKAMLRKDLAFFIGFFKAFVLLPKIIKSSFEFQPLFVKKDKEIIKEFSQ